MLKKQIPVNVQPFLQSQQLSNVAPYANPFSLGGNRTAMSNFVQPPLLKDGRALMLVSDDESSELFSVDSRGYGGNVGRYEEGELGVN